MKNSLASRIKRYENVHDNYLVSRMPVVVRVDGRSFHTLTKYGNVKKPFDISLIEAMLYAAKKVASEMQGFKIGYIQSDEATFVLTDYDKLNTTAWFHNRINKIVSISASLMSVYFNQCFNKFNKLAVFDSRAFNVPKEDVANVLLWRAKDWERNSIQMYARAFFSHKELHKKNKNRIMKMLNEIGRDWCDDLTDIEKYGTFLIRIPNGKIKALTNIEPKYDNIIQMMEKYDIIKYFF